MWLQLFSLDQDKLITECTERDVTVTLLLWCLVFFLENNLNFILYIFRYESATNSNGFNYFQ